MAEYSLPCPACGHPYHLGMDRCPAVDRRQAAASAGTHDPAGIHDLTQCDCSFKGFTHENLVERVVERERPHDPRRQIVQGFRTDEEDPKVLETAKFWRIFKNHTPQGEYLPVGQLDGDCRACGVTWPCPQALLSLRMAGWKHVSETDESPEEDS